MIERVTRAKRKIGKDVRMARPRYASFEEDAKQRDTKWNERYGGLCPVFGDNTNVPMPHANDAMENRMTCNSYDAENVEQVTLV